MKKLAAITFLVAIAFGLSANATPGGVVPSVNCSDDKEAGQTVSSIQGRLDWGFKCYEERMETWEFRKNAVLNTYVFGDTERYAYPVFGWIDQHDGSLHAQAAPLNPNEPCDLISKSAPGQKIVIVGFCPGPAVQHPTRN